jgi:lipoprotein-anchoring transpeptidase ErfK/SrfK
VLKQRSTVLSVVVGAILGAIVGAFMGASTDARAQQCDDRYPMNCRGFDAPAPQTPAAPFGPQMISPQRAPEPELLAPMPDRPGVLARPADPAVSSRYASLYAGIGGEPFPIPAVDLGRIDPQFLRRTVFYPTREPPGTIVIDPASRFLYLVQEGGQAIRYGVGVGREGFGWSGIANVREKREWPDWYPPKEMIQRQPELRRQLTELQSGIGMSGGPRNPLGARALYLWQGNKDTLFRIHGTVEPWTIGSSVSSGCIRMINQDVIDLYQRAPVNARVVVLGSRT